MFENLNWWEIGGLLLLALLIFGDKLPNVISDGLLDDEQAGQNVITTLHRAGCPVLWLHPEGLPNHTFEHTTTITATARIVRRTRSTCFIECDVVDEKVSLVARASSTCLVLQGEMAAGR